MESVNEGGKDRVENGELDPLDATKHPRTMVGSGIF
jgi:hypothetical protein